MPEVKGTPVFRYEIADYLDVGKNGTPDVRLMSVFETIDENPNAQTVEKHYTADRSATTLTSGYQTQFPIAADQYKDNSVVEFIRDIGEEQLIGVETDYFRVRLYQPIEGSENTFYARKFRVGFAIDSLGGAGGEIATVGGNMNTIGDVTIGAFNTVTRMFTPNLSQDADD